MDLLVNRVEEKALLRKRGPRDLLIGCFTGYLQLCIFNKKYGASDLRGWVIYLLEVGRFIYWRLGDLFIRDWVIYLL